MPQMKPCENCLMLFHNSHSRVRTCSFECGRKIMKSRDPIERFWSHVDKGKNCWEWTAAKKNGYGLFGRKVPGTVIMKGVYAHRHSWEIQNGPIPKGLCVLHKCDNRPCVRPDHLFIGTKADNTADMVAKGRDRQPRLKGSAQSGSKLTEANVLAIRASTESQPAEARKYGVSQVLISRIRLKRAWKHL